MLNKGQYRRLFALALLLATALGALGYRLVDLQVWQHDTLQRLAERNTHRTIFREPLRGQIRDIRGNPLALSIPTKIICADPTLVGNRQMEIARVLAPLLQTNENYLVERLQPRLRHLPDKTLTNSYVVLKRKVDLETWQKIEQAMTNLSFASEPKKISKAEQIFNRVLRSKAIFAQEDQTRVYPNHHSAAHVIGYVNGDEQAGRNGIELALDSRLSGVRGWRRTEMDSRHREIVAYRDQDIEPRNGLNVVLTLDLGLQNIVETELADAMQQQAPASVSAIVVRPRTGEILALATLPDFDANSPGAFPPEALRNRVITDISEPGSTFKIVVISAGLNERAIQLSDQFDCEQGRFVFAGRVLHDHESYGVLSVENIIMKSSNIGAAKVGLKLGEPKLYEYICNFGFGVRTGLPLPGEVNGIVHPVKGWSKVSIAQIPMGQGIAATSLQTVMAMSAIANHGRLMRPMLINRLEDDSGQTVAQFQPQAMRQVISSEAAQQMVSALKTVVSDEGTAPKARLENYTVAGKTGTAQKVENGQYARGKYFSSFIGFFPADDPELCISIVMDNPQNGHYGGQIVAPFFKNIAERAAHYLNLKPDIQPEQTLNETIAATK
ncbi:MAG: penicillin-binding protein 2 [Verrucomicrobiota bacterium]|nr:penicillin-binding protein 2 [Verrucomicrobiota bacterium]